MQPLNTMLQSPIINHVIVVGSYVQTQRGTNIFNATTLSIPPVDGQIPPLLKVRIAIWPYEGGHIHKTFRSVPGLVHVAEATGRPYGSTPVEVHVNAVPVNVYAIVAFPIRGKCETTTL